MFLNNYLPYILFNFAPNFLLMLYVVGTLFCIFSINALSKILLMSRTFVWSYVLGVVVWYLSLQRSLHRFYHFHRSGVSLNKLIFVVFIILLTKRGFIFLLGAPHYQNPVFFRKSKLVRAPKRSGFLAALS